MSNSDINQIYGGNNTTMIPEIVLQNYCYSNDPKMRLNPNFSYNNVTVKPKRKEIIKQPLFVKSTTDQTESVKPKRKRKRNRNRKNKSSNDN